MASEVERWHIGERHYGVTAVSTPHGFDLELDDLGPGVGRGLVAIASLPDDADQAVGLQVFGDGARPIDVLEQFIAEARRRL